MATMSESSDYWTGLAMHAQNMLGLWFAASQQPWMNFHFILTELFVRKGCQEAILQEFKDNTPLED